MVTRHIVKEVEELLEDMTSDCFVYGSDEVVTEESDANGADNNEMTTNRTHKCDGSCSSTNVSGTNGLMAVTKFFPWKRQKALFEIIMDFLSNQERLYKTSNTFKRKFTASFVSNLYRTKVTQQT